MSYTHGFCPSGNLFHYKNGNCSVLIIGLLATPKMWKIMLHCKSRKSTYCGNWNMCPSLAGCLFLCVGWLLWYHAGGMYDVELKDWVCSIWCSRVHWVNHAHTPRRLLSVIHVSMEAGVKLGQSQPELSCTSWVPNHILYAISLSRTGFSSCRCPWSQRQVNFIHISPNHNHEFSLIDPCSLCSFYTQTLNHWNIKRYKVCLIFNKVLLTQEFT